MKNVILAGGSGTRLWPLSRKDLAKQYLPLIDQHTMLQNTALRVSEEQGKDVFVIAGGDSKHIIHSQLSRVLPGFDEKNIVIEPCARNTAPAIAYGCLHFADDDIIGIFSSDHYIKYEKKFNNLLTQAASLAQEGCIVTLGIVPDSPRTGYGYIKASDKKAGEGFEVEQFVEKPDLEKARQYLAEGNYLWNAGIFIFKQSVFMEELAAHCPEVYTPLMDIKTKMAKGEEISAADFEKMTRISIDYAVMERSSKIVVIPSEIGWSDVGSFQSLFDLNEKDEQNNVIKKQGDFYGVNSENLLVYGEKRCIAAIGLSNLAIVDTPDALLISPLEAADGAGDIAKTLFGEGKKEAFSSETQTGWGSSRIIEKDEHVQVRKIVLKPGRKITYLNGNPGIVHLTLTEGSMEICEADNKLVLSDQGAINILPDISYRIINNSNNSYLTLIEVQTGSINNDVIK